MIPPNQNDKTDRSKITIKNKQQQLSQNVRNDTLVTGMAISSPYKCVIIIYVLFLNFGFMLRISLRTLT